MTVKVIGNVYGANRIIVCGRCESVLQFEAHVDEDTRTWKGYNGAELGLNYVICPHCKEEVVTIQGGEVR